MGVLHRAISISNVIQSNVIQSSGVIQVVNAVLMPK
jgi:hypothetical protein